MAGEEPTPVQRGAGRFGPVGRGDASDKKVAASGAGVEGVRVPGRVSARRPAPDSDIPAANVDDDTVAGLVRGPTMRATP